MDNPMIYCSKDGDASHAVDGELIRNAIYYKDPIPGICKVTRTLVGITICRDGDRIQIVGRIGDTGVIARLPCDILIYLLHGEYEAMDENNIETALSDIMMHRKVNNFYDYLLGKFDGKLANNVDFDVTRAIDKRTLHVTIDECTRAIIITPAKKEEET